MKTLILIAWRNVWRNRLRSGVVILSVVLGLWSGLFVMAMTQGLNEQRMQSAITTYLSHLQIHNPGFLENYDKLDTLSHTSVLEGQLDTLPHVRSYSERLILQGMASTARGNYGVQIMGIFPEQEKEVTSIAGQLTEGTYLNQLKHNPVLIGEELARRLDARIHSKVVLNFQDASNNTIAASFRVEGIFKTINSAFDQGTIFVKYEDIAGLTGLQGKLHEVAVLCDNIQQAAPVKARIRTADQVETWDELAPELGYAQRTMSSFIYIFMGIILLALAFGIVNTMLMAVLERKRELGMLLSVGMNKKRVFAMILLETCFLVLIATPAGIMLAFLTIRYFGEHGIDLSVVAKGLESLGMGARVFTSLPATMYLDITLMTLAVALLSAIVPARRALKLNPAEAVKPI